jgi:hypothetical protein
MQMVVAKESSGLARWRRGEPDKSGWNAAENRLLVSK